MGNAASATLTPNPFLPFAAGRGRKCLVLDLQLGGLLNQIIVEGSKLLKENGVQYFRGRQC